MRKIPITIVTGFLGVGKTTLVHQMLNNANGKRIALIVNEFGEVGVDGEIIKAGCGDEECNLIELSDGCICCTVQEEFLPAMLELIERKEDIDHIVIETSGLAMPKPLLRAVNWPDLKPHITIDSVITVVDAVGVATGEFCDRQRVQEQRLADESLDHETSIEELFLDQLTCADLVLVSKRDLVDDAKFEEISSFVQQKIRANTKIIPVVNGEVSNDLLLGLDASAEDDVENRHSIHEEHHHHDHDHGHDHEHHHHDHSHDHHHHHDHDHDDSLSTELLQYSETADIKQLVKELTQLVKENEIYRIKGFVNIPNKPMRMILQGVGDRFDYYFDRPWKEGETRKTHLVVIGKNLKLASTAHA
ncbi:cobalamin biosynthesis protein CobW [Flammeovirga sp. EKP202]|uniref:cobalamin biosynthesis protein CobW n=1 Tax=Flammeovirga sp. EKP202 TaxID=2770592 RepID=UPI00165F81A0|nr:cobalamin biosynthesis protein CobW [Flammeovirga sp. EKP202]MBD0402586.1 cobalamin biosynthesis protein CobW [Flammeovirga sp. EKP202]